MMKWINKNVNMLQTTRQRIFKNNIIFLVLLFLQNIVIFWQHYFNNVGFPWDFTMSYYAWQSFVTTAISTGVFPEWIPYQSMGYPYAINAQSGLHYPIFWIIALLHIPFTFNTAVILQGLHVLFGSIGMFFLLNSIFKSSRYAFIGAVAFQFFGGFYSNAQHADVIRGFAMAPWLFYVFKFNTEDPKITRQLLFIPIVIYFVASGAYPGIFISTFFIIPIFVSLQLIDSYLRHIAYRRLLKIGGAMAVLMILGISVSAIHVGPIWQSHNELTRFHDYASQVGGGNEGSSFQYFGTLFMSNTPLANLPNSDISQGSLFVTLPILIFASFICVSAIRKYWVFIAVMILSYLMVAGPQSPFWQIVTSAIPALMLSRFISSDYRVFMPIPIIILAIAGLRRVIERRLSWKEFTARATFVFAWFSVGIFFLYSSNSFFVIQKVLKAAFWESPQGLRSSIEIIAAVLILAATISFIVYYLRKNKALSLLNRSITLSLSALVIIVILISVNGFQVIYDMHLTWQERPSDKIYIDFNVPLEKNGKLITYSIFENIPNERPARHDTDSDLHNFSWMGYLNGSYMMQDYSQTILLARTRAESNSVYRQYMIMKWTPILLDRNFNMSSGSAKITLPESTFSNIITPHDQSDLCSKFTCDSELSDKNVIQPQSDANMSNQVAQTRYGINDIVYEVKLKEPTLMVENEIYFPGWKADLIFPEKQMKIDALVVNGIFRAWLLPAGEYKMIAHFHYPNLLVYQTISIISFAIWLFILVQYWRRLSGYKQQIKKKEFVTAP